MVPWQVCTFRVIFEIKIESMKIRKREDSEKLLKNMITSNLAHSMI